MDSRNTKLEKKADIWCQWNHELGMMTIHFYHNGFYNSVKIRQRWPRNVIVKSKSAQNNTSEVCFNHRFRESSSY